MDISGEPLEQFIADFDALYFDTPDEPVLLARGASLLRALVARANWLPPEYARSGPQPYGSYLLYAHPDDRYVVTSFVWSPGAATPIHDHDVWGLIGVICGCEASRRFSHCDGVLVAAPEEYLGTGQVDAVSPTIGDIHEVRNATSGLTVSIHVYGANLVTRPHRAFDRDSGKSRIIFSEPFLNQSPLIAHT